MVNGDLTAFSAAHDLPVAVGLLGQVSASRYVLQLARNRMLVASLTLDHAAAGWADGAATPPMTGALAVIEISGPKAMEILARASAVDPRLPSPCAAASFAGVTGALCRCGDSLRLHLDRGLVPFMLDCFSATRLVS